MSRLSRAMKREQKRAAAAGPVGAAPIDVRVPAGTAGTASIGGVPVTAGPGEEVQHAVLTHLQRIAVAGGHPVLATVHDERIGYVVPLRVKQDGSSHYTAEPVRTAAAAANARSATSSEPVNTPHAASSEPVSTPRAASSEPVSTPHAAPVAPPDTPRSARPAPPVAGPGDTVWPSAAVEPAPPSSHAPGDTVWPPAGPGEPERPSAGPEPYQDSATHVLRPLPGSVPGQDAGDEEEGAPTFRLRPIPTGNRPFRDAVPGTVAPPLGVFGPPPSMGGGAGALPDDRAASLGPDPEHAPPRGFDAVAEAVLGDPPPGAAAGSSSDTSPFAGPVERVNEAVRAGRTAEAAPLARQTVAEASAVLGAEHPEVLRMRELAAYIAYLGDEPEQAFTLSLAVAWAHHRAPDAEAAYSALHGAATAWRAVRNPAQGLDLGRELLTLWDALVAGGGPAAEDVEELDSARARMDRLATRAAKSDRPPAG